MDKSTIPSNAGERIRILRQLGDMSQEDLGRKRYSNAQMI